MCAQAADSRAALGACPVQRRNALEKADCSENPSRKVISLRVREGSATAKIAIDR
jgi:hypothetical protein